MIPPMQKSVGFQKYLSQSQKTCTHGTTAAHPARNCPCDRDYYRTLYRVCPLARCRRVRYLCCTGECRRLIRITAGTVREFAIKILRGSPIPATILLTDPPRTYFSPRPPRPPRSARSDTTDAYRSAGF